MGGFGRPDTLGPGCLRIEMGHFYMAPLLPQRIAVAAIGCKGAPDASLDNRRVASIARSISRASRLRPVRS